jgi:hypothetical protein
MAGITKDNYKVAPAMDFGTATLGFYKVVVAEAVHTNYADSGSLYQQAVNALQGHMELYGVGTPASNSFVIVVNENTVDKWDDTANTNADFSKAEASVNAITGLSSAAITALTASGASIA